VVVLEKKERKVNMRSNETQHLHQGQSVSRARWEDEKLIGFETVEIDAEEAVRDFIVSLNTKLSHLFFDNLNELCDVSLRLLQTRLKKSDVVWSYLEEVETALKYAEKCDEELNQVEEEAA
jgi:hypothetical protein